MDTLTLSGVKETRETRRAYDAYVDYQVSGFQETSIATMRAFTGDQGSFPILAPIRLVPSLLHRRAWVFFFGNTNQAWFADMDLVFWLDKTEVFRQKFMQWESSGAANLNWIIGAWLSSQQGTYGGEIFAQIPGNPFLPSFAITPQTFNIQADSCAIVVNQLTGATAVFDCLLQVLSFGGI